MSNKPFSTSAWDALHFQRTEAFARRIEQIYQQLIKEAAAMASKLKTDPKKPFSFSDYPAADKQMNALLSEMSGRVLTTITAGQESEWMLANLKNDALVASVVDTTLIPKANLSRFMPRNLNALSAFQKRKTAGMGLSDRVWKQNAQLKTELELGLDIGLGEGRSASQLSRDIRSYLNEPDKLFRRVRDKRGNLALSKAAQAYHPGQGVYRSAYKNAQRLARTEINMAYRESDHERFKALDFVVGYEVRRSNNPYGCDVCESLKGKYPKTFKFVGWHPNCRCHVVSILATADELRTMNRMLLRGEDTAGLVSQNTVTDTPAAFKKWVSDNQDRLNRAKTKPLFLSQNSPGFGSVPSTAKFVPGGLDQYEQQLGVTVKRDIFRMLKQNVPMVHSYPQAFFSPSANLVNIEYEQRRKNSKWAAESVVYHEFGHAIDHQQGLRSSSEVTDLMKTYREKWAKKGEIKYIKLNDTISDQATLAYFDDDHDTMEKLTGAADTIMALNQAYGFGHTQDYWKRAGSPEAEFIAHAFENYFIGNDVFGKLMPDLYRDMRKLVAKWYKRMAVTQP